jgi:ABC-type polysaccharide/polyol phosphate export permease
VLQMIFMLLTGHAIVSPGLSGFANGSVFLAKILAQADIFFIWNAILLIMGFGIADGLPKSKATIGVVAVLLILVLVLAGTGAAVSSLGGTLSS